MQRVCGAYHLTVDALSGFRAGSVVGSVATAAQASSSQHSARSVCLSVCVCVRLCICVYWERGYQVMRCVLMLYRYSELQSYRLRAPSNQPPSRSNTPQPPQHHAISPLMQVTSRSSLAGDGNGRSRSRQASGIVGTQSSLPRPGDSSTPARSIRHASVVSAAQPLPVPPHQNGGVSPEPISITCSRQCGRCSISTAAPTWRYTRDGKPISITPIRQ